MTRTLLFASLVAGALTLAAGNSPTASRQRSGYTDFFIGSNAAGKRYDVGNIHRRIDILGDNGFNAMTCFVYSYSNDPAGYRLEPEKEVLKGLIDHAHRRGLTFNVYLYPHPVSPKRELLDNLDKAETWRTMYPHLMQWVRLRKYLGYESLRFDIEPISLTKKWDEAGKARIQAAVGELVGDIRAVEPDLPLGFMPAEHHPLSEQFERVLATPRAPAFCDAWDLYNGCSFLEKIAQGARRVKELNPNNKFIVWMRINSYNVGDVAATLYQSAKATDGYDLWSLGMVDPGCDKWCTPGDFCLPAGTKPQDYHRAYAKANAALASGREIPFKEVTPIVPPLKFETVRFPKKGEPFAALPSENSLVLCGHEVIFVRAKAGDTVAVAMKHLAGQARPLALHYAFVMPDGSVLRNESIRPGAGVTWSASVPADGIYAVVASAGTGGQAWWSVGVKDLPWCVDARQGRLYLFGPQSIRVPGRKMGNPAAANVNYSTQAYRWRVGGKGDWAEVIRGNGSQTFKTEDGPTLIEFRDVPGVAYTQDFWISFPEGRMKYVFAK